MFINTPLLIMNWHPDNENVSTATDLGNNNNNNNNKNNNKKLSKCHKIVYKNQEPYNEYFLTILTTSLINLSLKIICMWHATYFD